MTGITCWFSLTGRSLTLSGRQPRTEPLADPEEARAAASEIGRILRAAGEEIGA
ncbi:hypothetical protein [Streptomyces sp. NPDC059455]|uniref:hypothetical protein n=1 Tax=Streptomyces sp. NPDC059455 TaxID=3346837 RepID=UPI0036C54978